MSKFIVCKDNTNNISCISVDKIVKIKLVNNVISIVDINNNSDRITANGPNTAEIFNLHKALCDFWRRSFATSSAKSYFIIEINPLKYYESA